MIFCVFLASGHGKRFGGNKLLYEYDGAPLAERAFRALPPDLPGVVVTRSNAVAALARAHGNLSVCMNPDKTDDVSETVRLGMRAVPPEAEGAMFLVCDQPALTRRSVTRLALTFERRPDRICVLAWRGRSGNPCVFPRALFGELRSLPPGKGGKALAERYPELVLPVEAFSGAELRDADTRRALAELQSDCAG